MGHLQSGGDMDLSSHLEIFWINLQVLPKFNIPLIEQNFKISSIISFGSFFSFLRCSIPLLLVQADFEL